MAPRTAALWHVAALACTFGACASEGPDDGWAGASGHGGAGAAATGGSGATAGTMETGGAGGSSATGGTGGAGGAMASGGAGGAGNRGEPADAGSDEDAAPSADADSVEGVTLKDGRLLVDDEPFSIRGVCWNPVDRGGNHPADVDFAGFVEEDGALMRAAGINVVRTYEPITDTAVLDALQDKGIYVLNMVYAWGGEPPSAVDAKVDAVKDHPAILMWVLGNEWNYNGLYVGMSHDDSLAAINEAAERIRALDDRPIASVYGEVPSRGTVEAMPMIDVWGINAYRGLSFGDLFDRLAEVTDKPIFLAEYGADAYDANQDAVNVEAQAAATQALTEEILDSGVEHGGQCLGGTIFEWADEWWKDGDGSPSTQEAGGIAPGGGPHPDQTFNEEWWGIVDIDRNPRPAYDALKALYSDP